MSKIKAFVIAFKGLIGLVVMVIYLTVATILFKRSEIVSQSSGTWGEAATHTVAVLILTMVGLGLLCVLGYSIACLYKDGAADYRKRCQKLNKSNDLLEWVKSMDPDKVEMFKTILEKDGKA